MSYQLPDPNLYYTIVWEIVRQVPTGRVVSFGQLAAMIPTPPGIDPEVYQRLGPRWVGDAMNAVSGPEEVNIPWHRVINSRGSISLPPESTAAAVQRGRLRHEGVTFNAKEATDFDEFGWDGPDPDWLEAHGLQPPPSLKTPPATGPQQLSLF